MHSTETIDPLNWNTFEPRFTTLLKEELTSQLIPSWLERWSDLEKIIWEIRAGLKRDRSWDETNAVAQKAYQRFIEEVFSPYQMVSQALKTKLLSMAISIWDYAKELEDVVVKWLPSIALVDAFQHWVYASAPENVTPADLDEKWLELSSRFDPGIDWTGLEQERALGWQRVGIMFSMPFYQIEYALAHLGALQVWQKAQNDFVSAWHSYREALLLGNTRSLPELYRAAGAELPFEREMVKKMADFLASSFDRRDLSI